MENMGAETRRPCCTRENLCSGVEIDPGVDCQGSTGECHDESDDTCFRVL